MQKNWLWVQNLQNDESNLIAICKNFSHVWAYHTAHLYNTTKYLSNNLPYYSANNHHCSNVYRRGWKPLQTTVFDTNVDTVGFLVLIQRHAVSPY